MGKVPVTNEQVEDLKLFITTTNEKTIEAIQTWVKDIIWGVNRDNGINKKIDRNTADIKELDDRVDILEKAPEQIKKSDDKLENKKLIIDLWKAIIIGVLVFLGTGTGAFIIGKIWP